MSWLKCVGHGHKMIQRIGYKECKNCGFVRKDKFTVTEKEIV